MKITGPQKTIRRARALRVTMTPPEIHLWQILRQRANGLKFRRQHPCGPYILDFYCDAAKLCVEIDGDAHNMGNNPAQDEARDAALMDQGIATLRFSVPDVMQNLEGVIRQITSTAHPRSR